MIVQICLTMDFGTHPRLVVDRPRVQLPGVLVELVRV